MNNDTKILAIAFVVLLAMGFLSFSFTGSFISKNTRGLETRELTEILISNDGENFVKDKLINVKFGRYVYFKIKTGNPFGTNSLVKFFWYPSDISGVFKEEVYKGGYYISGCGKPYCRGGLNRELKHLTLGLEKGLNCAVFYDRGFEKDVKICFNVI